jgi:tripartite-type tricarboxylate transporter receptor subunit TctC
MKRPGRQSQLAAGVAALGILSTCLSNQGAWSQTTKTIRIVVPTPPGASDTTARMLADHVSQAQGLTMVIDNRPGAGTVIGTEAVSRATPDGNTLLVNAPPAFVISPHLRKLGYDPLGSFEPICSLVSFPIVIAVNGASPYRTLADLTNAARAEPGELTLASVGPASLTHIGFEMIKRAANVNMTFVPYPGTGPAVNALLGGHVTSYFGNYTDAAMHVKAGKLRALAIATRTRFEPLPDVPTVAESGYKDYEVDAWFGLFAPAKTPKGILSQLAGWFTTALQAPEVKAKLIALGLKPVGMCGPDFATLLRKQYAEYGRMIREANIKAE